MTPPYGTYIQDYAIAADGALWALAYPGLLYHPPF